MLWWVFLVTVIHVRCVYGVSDRFSKNIRYNRICHLSALLEVLLLHFLYWTRFWCTYNANKTYTLWWTYVVGWGTVVTFANLSKSRADLTQKVCWSTFCWFQLFYWWESTDASFFTDLQVLMLNCFCPHQQNQLLCKHV